MDSGLPVESQSKKLYETLVKNYGKMSFKVHILDAPRDKFLDKFKENMGAS